MDNTIVYEDACGSQFPVTVGGCRINSSQELELVAAAQGISDDDTIMVRISNDCAEFGAGDPIRDKDDVTRVCSNGQGVVVIEGLGG